MVWQTAIAVPLNIFPCYTKGECAINPIGIQAQLTKVSDPFLYDGERLIFNKILDKSGCFCPDCNCGCSIRYRKKTGEFVLEKCGTYLVNWSVAVGGSRVTPYIRFALQVNNDIFCAVAFPVSVGLISGSSLVVLKHKDTSVSLINNTKDSIRLADVAPIANIVISKI